MTDSDDLTTVLARIASHVDPARSTPDGCWHWHGTEDNRQRPRIKVDGRTEHARDLVRTLTNATGWRCTNPHCVNPRPHQETAAPPDTHLEHIATAHTRLLTNSDALDPHGFYVYCLWSDDDMTRPIYVGLSTNLFVRLGTHMAGPKRHHTNRITVTKCQDETEMERLEAQLIRHFQPRFNTIGVWEHHAEP